MLHFLKQFILHPRETGAIAPSSAELADCITEHVARANAVVELGPGNGIFTKRILEKKQAHAVFFALEKNPIFAERTRVRYPACNTHLGTAADLQRYLQQEGLKQCDCIISGLPWAAFDRRTQKQLLDSIVRALVPGGTFSTFAYIHGMLLPAGKNFRQLLRQKFREVHQTKVVWKNIPPAFVYHCRK